MHSHKWRGDQSLDYDYGSGCGEAEYAGRSSCCPWSLLCSWFGGAGWYAVVVLVLRSIWASGVSAAAFRFSWFRCCCCQAGVMNDRLIAATWQRSCTNCDALNPKPQIGVAYAGWSIHMQMHVCKCSCLHTHLPNMYQYMICTLTYMHAHIHGTHTGVYRHTQPHVHSLPLYVYLFTYVPR